MTELMRSVRAAATLEDAVALLVAAGYERWEALATAQMERGGVGINDVLVDGEPNRPA